MEERSALKQLIDRDEFVFSEFLSRKTEGLVFDKRTLDSVYLLFKQFNIVELDFPISSGKESIVYRAKGAKGSIVIKIYKTSTLKFQRIAQYIDGDPRFNNLRRTKSNIVDVWAQKEYANLLESRDKKINVPAPFGINHNVLLMKYIGSAREPARKLKDVVEKDMKEYFLKAMEQYVNMVQKAKIIHADFSEYNILCYRRKSYIIDMGQAVSYKHPMARIFFKRDMDNMKNFGLKNGIDLPSALIPVFPGDENE